MLIHVVKEHKYLLKARIITINVIYEIYQKFYSGHNLLVK